MFVILMQKHQFILLFTHMALFHTTQSHFNWTCLFKCWFCPEPKCSISLTVWCSWAWRNLKNPKGAWRKLKEPKGVWWNLKYPAQHCRDADGGIWTLSGCEQCVIPEWGHVASVHTDATCWSRERACKLQSRKRMCECQNSQLATKTWRAHLHSLSS